MKTKDEPDNDDVIADLINQCHNKTRITYDYCRVKIWLFQESGLIINRKAAFRIMRKCSLLVHRKLKRFINYDSENYYRYDNLLDRNFKTDRSNLKWVMNISCIPTKQVFLYLSIIKDLYGNSIVAYRYATEMPTRLVTGTIIDSVKKEKITMNLQLYSNQGFQYTPSFNYILYMRIENP